MKRTKHCQMCSRHLSSYSIGIAIYLICVQWISIDSVFVNAAVAAGSVIGDKVTLPSRNDATNPLKEPTPSTLQGTFLGSNLTDANNGSTSTPPADAQRRQGEDETFVASTTAAAAAAEAVWNARTAAVATLPVDQRNESVTVIKSDPATTNRPLESWENVVHTNTEQPSSSQSPVTSTTDHYSVAETTTTTNNGNRGSDLSNNNIMAKMLKSWFNHKDDTASSAKRYYKLAAEYLQKNGDGRQLSKIVSSSSSSSSKAESMAVVGGNKNLFERWDEASEEQERVLEDAMRSESTGTDISGGDSDGVGSPSSSSSSVLAADQNTPSRWFVLLLSGNSTVAQMRRTDFAKYLKLNLAARLSLEYDEVKINRVLVVPPRLMVNVSVVPVPERAPVAAAAAASAATAAVSPSSSSSSSSSPRSSSTSVADASDRVAEDDDPLHNLVETNATLMELSGEEYRVERFMSLKSQKPQSMEESAVVVSNRHADIDFFIYATVGPLCFVVVLGFLLLTLYKYVRKHPVQWPWKRKLRQPSFWPGGDHQHRHRRMTEECCSGDGGGKSDVPLSADAMHSGTINVIYSGEFEQSQQQQLSGSWLDDASFVPDDSLDRIRTPTLLRTATPPAAKNKTFTDMLQQCSDGGVGSVGIVDDDHQRHHYHHGSSRGVQCSAVAASSVHAQSPRLSRDNKLRILGCKQSCLLLPAVQPATADDNTPTPQSQPPPPPPPSQSKTARGDDYGGRP